MLLVKKLKEKEQTRWMAFYYTFFQVLLTLFLQIARALQQEDERVVCWMLVID